MESKAFTAVLEEQTGKLAEELSAYANRPVVIELRNGKESKNIGSSGRNSTKVTLTAATLDRVRQDDHKLVIWRGLAYHQLLNALTPNDSQRRTAAKEGFGPLYTVLSDEQNERLATAKDPTLGAAFQSVCSYVYTGKNRKRNDALVLSGEEQKTSGEDQTYTSRVNEFAFHLRRHLATEEGVTDATVIEASNLIPSGLKDLTKDELLVLARQIHERLVRGVTVARPLFFDPIATLNDDNDKIDVELANTDEEDADELAKLTPIDKRWWQIVLKSRWSYATLGAFVVGWLILALSVGIDFWRAVVICSLAGAALCAVVFGIFALARKRDNDEGEPIPPRVRGTFWKRFWSAVGKLWPFEFRGFGKFGEQLGACWKSFWSSVADAWRGFKRFVVNASSAIGESLEKCWRTPLARHLRTSFKDGVVSARNWVVRTSSLAWRSPTVRLAIVAVPIAVLLAILFAIVSVGAELMLWQLVLLVVAWFAIVGLGFVFREKLKNFLIADLFNDEEVEHDVECTLTRDKKTRTFGRITATAQVDADPVFLSRNTQEIEDAARRLQSSLDRIGFVTRELENREEGHDLIEDIETVFLGQTEVCVDDEQVNRLALNAQILVDCSQSQADATRLLKRGEKLSRSKKFALALERAIVGKRRATCNLWGFNDTTIFDCGRAGQARVSGLKAAGGNNDAAALLHASQMASGGADTVKLIVLISDDQQADCSWGALNELGFKLIQQGFIVVQVVVDSTDDPALPWHVIDLHTQSVEEAAADLGHVLEARLAKG